MARRTPDPPLPAERVRAPWSRSERPVPRAVLRPLQAFLDTEAAGGVLLLVAAVIALVWANSPWRGSYESLWGTTFAVRVGDSAISLDLRHWIGDGGMALFFVVVGLEIKRELLTGELRHRRAAVLPAIAAVGGMVVPALIYLALNAGGPGGKGWGIPMATDIAFALGVLTLAAPRAPSGLKSFLLTLAILDDIGATLVITVFYSRGVDWPPLLVALGMAAMILGLQRIHVRATVIYVVLGVGLWLATLQSGVNPAIAGAVLGFLTPAVPFQRPRAVSDEAHRVADETVDDPHPPDVDAPQWLYLTGLAREAVSPLARTESVLHPWTSFVIVPLFALANAGVAVTGRSPGGALADPITIGIVAGLVVGKVTGITLAGIASVRMGVARLPEGVTWRLIAGAAMVAGIGFTISLLIAGLAFADAASVDAAKVGVLGASLLAGVLGFGLLRSAANRAPTKRVPSGPRSGTPE